ncbi:MAG: RsmE family RNA methyltransferase [Ferruginibacter sp.]
MDTPRFFIEQMPDSGTLADLPEEAARHAVQSLRMQPGEALLLCNGCGRLAEAVITETNKRRCGVRVGTIHWIDPPVRRVVMAVSPLKQAARFEWFLEKATELGVQAIVPILCSRTEKTKLRTDRLRAILISAMIQSQQAWLPELREPVSFMSFVANCPSDQKLIAHCEAAAEKKQLAQLSSHDKVCMLIGPEGDFTSDEIASAINNGFQPVTLGDNRLRTETAALSAAVWLTCRH